MLRKIFIVFLLLQGTVLFSQTTSSPFSRSGIGLLDSDQLMLGDNMGGALSAIRSKTHINIGNPASYTAFDSTSFISEVGAKIGGSFISENDGQTFSSNSGFEYLAIGFPVTKWWGSSISLLPYSQLGYDFSYQENLPASVGYTYSGTGGLRNVNFGNAFGFFNKQLNVGLNASYVWGVNKYKRSVDFLDEYATDLRGSEVLNINGFAFEAGLQYELNLTPKDTADLKKKLPRKKEKMLVFGVTMSPEQTLDYSGYEYLVTGEGQFIDTLFQSDAVGGTSTLPMKYSFGVGYVEKNKFSVFADYQSQDWTGIDVFGNNLNLNQFSRISIGAEKYGNSDNGRKGYRRFKYRFGMYFADSNTDIIASDGTLQPVTEIGGNIGIGIPMFKILKDDKLNNVNLSLNFGQRGISGSDEIKENYLLLNINLTLHETWFFKRRID